MNNNNTPERKVQAREKINIPPWATVKLYAQGATYAEVVYMAKERHGATIQPLDKDTYLVIKTGEVKKFSHNDRKQRGGLRKTFAELKGILRANFDAEGHNQLFVTLTYKENMTDPERLYADFEKFYKRLCYEHKDHKLEYVAVAEPQGRGAWHMHLMIKSDKPILYIDNRDMARIWGHGYTSVERLKSDDVGRYYVAYFTDLELDEQTIVQSKSGKKKYRKGARLQFYPLKFKLYRCSRGIIRPKGIDTTYNDVTNEYGKPYYANSFDILQDDERLNTIQTESFKRQKGEEA